MLVSDIDVIWEELTSNHKMNKQKKITISYYDLEFAVSEASINDKIYLHCNIPLSDVCAFRTRERDKEYV